MGCGVVRLLGDNLLDGIALNDYLVTIRHMLESNEPEVRQAGVDPLAVTILDQGINPLFEDFSKSVRGFHRHSVVIGR